MQTFQNILTASRYAREQFGITPRPGYTNLTICTPYTTPDGRTFKFDSAVQYDPTGGIGSRIKLIWIEAGA